MIMHSGLTLAYLGDAIYELEIRKYILSKGFTKVNDLHKLVITFTSAKPQAKAIWGLIDNFLTEDEIQVYKRGRNATSTHKPKNADLDTYRASTGFEALLGYLYLQNDEKRLSEVILKSIQIIEEHSL